MKSNKFSLGSFSPWVVLLLFSVLILAASPARAQVQLYSDFGPGYAINPPASQFVTSAEPDGGTGVNYEAVANAFTIIGVSSLTGRFALAKIDVAMAGPNPYTVQLTEDAGGVPGTVLETWSGPVPTGPVTTFTDTLGVQLRLGTQYWVVVLPIPNGTNDSWAGGFGSSEPNDVLVDYVVNNTIEILEPWASCSSAGIYPCPANQAFDVWGYPVNLGWPPVGAGINQIIRVIAGPITPAPGTPVEANISFVDLNGNAIGPNETVIINPGQTSAPLDLVVNNYINAIGQRVEVVPVITQLPNPNAAEPGGLSASVQVLDQITGFGTSFPPALQYPPSPVAPSLVAQTLAGSQTMRINVLAFPPDPCYGTLSFADRNGNPLGTNKQVNLAPGTGASLDLPASTVGLQLGQRIVVQPIVAPTVPIGTAVVVTGSACQASVEVFESATGRTWSAQTATAQVP